MDDIKTIDFSNINNIDKDELLALVLEEYKDKPNIIIKDENEETLANIGSPQKEYIYLIYNKTISKELRSLISIEDFTIKILGEQLEPLEELK